MTPGPPDMVFNVWCALSPHTIAVPQWRVMSNVSFLTGRLGGSHMMHISRDDYLSRNNTSEPPDMVFNVQCVSSAPYCWQMQPFLSGRLGVKWRSSLAGWEYHTWCIYQETIICPEITHGFQCLMCFTCHILLSNSAIPQWPVGSNVVFLTDRLGVSHIMSVSRDDYLSRNNTSEPRTWFSIFNVFHVPHIVIKCSHSSVAGWESPL